ncbi:DUF1524 domain-containing protein [Amycolatopsis sp. cmx-4-83]|uniref:GmrSD restriction endonuclease domain-containing protein n=1 Tax=Amycolatopsis sp. cmx-4-83 TaxID=2790940 RepID=UPI00397E3CE9
MGNYSNLPFRQRFGCAFHALQREARPSELSQRLHKQSPRTPLQQHAKSSANEQFRNDFSTAVVRRTSYSRYYLRSLEIENLRPKRAPEFIANPNTSELNLEHILPQSATKEWASMFARPPDGVRLPP